MEESPAVADSESLAGDPVAVFLSDPESHLSDILYLNFRVYKRRLIWRFLETALGGLAPKAQTDLVFGDIGAGMGHDMLYLLRRWTDNFRRPLPCRSLQLSLVEGNAPEIKKGSANLKSCLPPEVAFTYYPHPMVEGLPLPDSSHDLLICSEVVEHLEHPERLLAEMHRVLKPGGYCALTTDNSPSLLQRIRRVPVYLFGNYAEKYPRPNLEAERVATTHWNGREYPIYGHINLNPSTHWEKLGRQAGFDLVDFGTYESIRRGGGSGSPLKLSFYYLMGAVNYYLLPRRLARHLGDTTALLWRKPVHSR